ncbi:MAG: carboxylating nicotinate-nucleotide diphosphorylase [Planctomycetota bacterium]|nr:carboxylating nicotinate-nucleotide diphosphorylase [Planctomycetota bacterium]
MQDLNQLSLPDLFSHLCESGLVRRLLEVAREEDVGSGDVTSAASFTKGGESGIASITAREPGILCGIALLPLLIDVFEVDATSTARLRDGERFESGETIATLEGRLDHILTLERTLLNLFARLSGVATLTRRYVAAAAGAPGSRAGVYDTRKTTPGLRMLEKYAVRCGGGRNHRIGLSDALLIKDNHIASIPEDRLADRLREIIREARADRDLRFVEVEVDRLSQFERILGLEPGEVDIVLLDNMKPDQLREAVQLRDDAKSRIELEASGGVTLETIGGIAATGIERISVGRITQSAPPLDIGLDLP